MLLCRTELAVSLGHKPSTTVRTAVVQPSSATQPPRCFTFPCKGTCHGSVLQWRLWAWVASSCPSEISHPPRHPPCSPILFDFGGQAVKKACAFSTPPHLKKYAFPAMGCAASSLNQVGLQIHAIAQILTTSKVWRGRDQPQQASASEAGHLTSHPAAQEVFCWALCYGRDSSVGRASD